MALGVKRVILAVAVSGHTIGRMPATDDELKKALKAFKKRLKLTRLDDESKLGHSPLTGGGAKIVEIQPPSGFGREIWEELAAKGVLKNEGRGFYRLVEGKELS
jgi:hypothetical protein